MSKENVEALRRGYAAVNRGDIDGLLMNVQPDVEFTSLIAEAEGEIFHGHDGVWRWWKEVVLPLSGLHGEPEEVRDLGDTVIARVAGTYRPRGVEVRRRSGTWSASTTRRPRRGGSAGLRTKRSTPLGCRSRPLTQRIGFAFPLSLRGAAASTPRGRKVT
jgi:ketosteroid isomerase-like protein